jgi:hypothetical protein
MAIGLVQEISDTGTSSGGTVIYTATFNAASQAGNLLIALICFNGSATPDIPTGFTLATSNTNADGSKIYLYYQADAPSTTTISTKVIATVGAANSCIIFIAEWQGVQQSSPLDQTGSGSSASGTVPTGSVTTTSAYELLIAGVSDLAGDTFSSPTNGFILLDQDNVGSGATLQAGGFLYNVVTSTGTYSSSVTNSSTTGGNGVIASFISIPGTVPAYNSIFFAAIS